MKVLILAPQPFFEPRGTPIAVKLLAETLASLGHEVDLMVFGLGRDVEMPGVTVLRAPRPWGIKRVGPGLSAPKLVCDTMMLGSLAGRLMRNRYDAIHAVEESAFMAATLGRLMGVPFVFDMDSSMPEQIADAKPALRPLRRPMGAMEGWALRRSVGVLAVCQALADRAGDAGTTGHVAVLEDISIVPDTRPDDVDDLRQSLGIDGPMYLYVGNLETYQGIDLMLEGFAHVASRRPDARLVVIGGETAHIERYTRAAESAGLGGAVHFVGPRPIDALGAYLDQADVLMSPRTQGGNTPMKLYSYMDSGVPIVATRLETHTQAIDETMAFLCDTTGDAMGEAMLAAVTEADARQRGSRAKARVAERYSAEAYRRKLADFYAGVADTIAARHGRRPAEATPGGDDTQPHGRREACG